MQRAKVLVVDDEPRILKAVKAMLVTHGLDVIAVQNAEQALDIVEKQRGEISVVLSDVRMPGMSGPQLISKVVELSPVTAVALMSGDIGIETIEPQIPVIPKPFKLKTLIETIEGLLGRRTA